VGVVAVVVVLIVEEPELPVHSLLPLLPLDLG